MSIPPENSLPVLSVVIPVLNEAAVLPSLLATLKRQLACVNFVVEVIFVDGASVDNSAELIRAQGYSCVHSERGRAQQMNAGAAQASAGKIIFLHADSDLADGGLNAVVAALGTKHWGRFDVRISGDAMMFFVIAFCMNWRSRLSGIATGDQGIFVRRASFEKAGGFPNQALMEDIALSVRLRKLSSPACLKLKVCTSGRRWQQRGIWRTIFLMWRLRFTYWLGASPQKLAKRYE